MRRSPGRLLCFVVFLLICSFVNSQKIAIIGGGITGTFTSKYLVDYDGHECKLDSITLFDPNELGMETSKAASNNKDLKDDEYWQGSRVAAIKLQDGRVVEVGASVFHEANHLLKGMIEGDPNLEIGRPFTVGKEGDVPQIPTRAGLAIYDGDGSWTYTSNSSSPWNKLQTLVRYNLDLFKVERATQKATAAFESLPALLNSTEPDTFFESPDEIWNRIKLYKPVHVSFERLLDFMRISKPDSWSQKILPMQGSLRAELLTAINLINYNQPNAQINGLVGLVSYAAAKGPLYSVVGGNHQIVRSAFSQAQSNRRKNCPKNEEEMDVSHQKQKVTTVIGSIEGFELYAGNVTLGTFDSVILAAPLQQCRIEFLVPSAFDGAVLHQMPLGGMVDPEKSSESCTDHHDGHPILPTKLPSWATNSFTQVVTTVVSQATVNHTYFNLLEENLPRAICTTERGKAKEHNMTVISQIAGDGVYKVFSSNVLKDEYLDTVFGPHHKVEFVKVWGGTYGGATPDYRGLGDTVGFLLYDGATNMDGHTDKGALYYPNAIETALACMEASAVGAKAVAKLVARRFKLLSPSSGSSHNGEEL